MLRSEPLRRAIVCASLAVLATAGTVAEDAPQLDSRNVELEMDDDGILAGEITYSLVVGTYYEWNTDPTAVPGLFSEVSRRTKIEARVDFSAVTLESEELFTNPFLIMTGNRFFSLTDEEIANLKNYVLAGGFIYADDCGGADWSFRHMISKILPDHKLEEVPKEHPVFKSHYELTEVPKILDLYGTQAKGFGVFIDGRLAVFYTYDTDVPCGWEKNPDGSFVHLLTPRKHEEAMKFGVNVIVYALRDLHGKTAKHTAAEEVNDAVE